MYQPWQCVSVLYESRTNKTPLEIEVLRVASNVSSEAHIAVMQRSRAGLYEYNLQSMCVCAHAFKACKRLTVWTIRSSRVQAPSKPHALIAGTKSRQLQILPASS